MLMGVEVEAAWPISSRIIKDVDRQKQISVTQRTRYWYSARNRNQIHDDSQFHFTGVTCFVPVQTEGPCPLKVQVDQRHLSIYVTQVWKCIHLAHSGLQIQLAQTSQRKEHMEQNSDNQNNCKPWQRVLTHRLNFQTLSILGVLRGLPRQCTIC